MPGRSSARVPGRIFWLQHQCGPLRSDDLHGLETQSTGESGEAQVCHVPPGERESNRRREGSKKQKGFTSVGKPWLTACHAPSLLFVSPATSVRHLSYYASLYALTCLLPYALAVYSEAPDLFTYCLLRQLTRFPPGPKFRHSYVQ